ncbi:Uncharacterised protein [Mycolicibacterium phlei]|uniref:hypothetical protein n=1 Tax=Mycobacteroides chelonae TaxID=1774 RepID=UPI000B0621B5|nr:hypothetical protein [Mycobacteroides chelonae]VEG15846.1 Uncharacterised protein [Mycolicibacterium phlei]
MPWQPLSDRSAGTQPDGPYEGAPDHLKFPILEWISDHLGVHEHSHFVNPDRDVLREIGIRFRLPLATDTDPTMFALALISRAKTHEAFVLDLADALLDMVIPQRNRWRDLNHILSYGASVWRVNDDGTSLVRTVTEEAQATFDAATATAGEATNELREAWTNAFGRNGDASDAWDHAIKAVEDVLIPAVVPSKAKATLGDVLGQLGSSQSAGNWKMILPGHDQTHDVAPLVAMLRLMWPNHDRHGGGPTPKRMPSAEEARAVVSLAATILQWHRDGWAIQRR